MAERADPAGPTARPAAGGDGGPPPRVAGFLKWVAGVTGILSLVFGVHQLTQMVSDVRERQRQTAELHDVGKRQQAAKDYPAAWASFEQGARAAEPGGKLAKLTGQLGKERAQLRAAQEDLAMEWLENVRVNPARGESFTRIADTLTPALHRGVASAEGPRKADMLAHLGWADFLRWRDGRRELDPEPHYRQAVGIDPANPYAHAYWGHWLLWTKQQAALPQAREHFTAALASGRVREHVRHTQLAAIATLGQSGDTEYLRVANEMRKNNERLDASARNELYGRYSMACRGRRIGEILGAGPMADHQATFRAWFTGPEFDESKARGRDACLANLLEAAGQRDDARQLWITIRGGLAPDDREWRDRADAAIKRLSAPR